MTPEQEAERERRRQEYEERQREYEERRRKADEELQRNIAEGKQCKTCHGWYPRLFATNGPVNCYECEGIHKAEELDHSKYVRCPKCRSTFDPSDQFDDKKVANIWQGEDIELWCSECDHMFSVGTHCSVSFTSPPLEEQKVEKDEEDEAEVAD